MNYPFTAIVGQSHLKKALLLCAINPAIGGLLIQGDKGTAKSTAARALTGVLPSFQIISECRFNCSIDNPVLICETCIPDNQLKVKIEVPFINLPLGATEERILGSLDLGAILVEKKKKFQPGLLAAVHRGILYIDEVNLLADHLVDLLLDVAAMGENRIERDGLSLSHPSKFILLGTMNPEEGQLRPQLLDRFGLMVRVDAPDTISERTEVVRRRIAFEDHPAAFTDSWKPAQELLLAQVTEAKELLRSVVLPDELLELIARITTDLQVKSLRADLVIYKTAVTLAALDHRVLVTEDDIREAADLALGHRVRNYSGSGPSSATDPGSHVPGTPAASPDPKAITHNSSSDGQSETTPGPDPDTDSDLKSDPDSDTREQNDPGSPLNGNSYEPGAGEGSAAGEGSQIAAEVQVITPPADFSVQASGLKEILAETPGLQKNKLPGTRTRVIGSEVASTMGNLAADQTVLHALIRNNGEVIILPEDLQQKKYQIRQEKFLLFVVDASGSMAAGKRMEAVKGTVLSLLGDTRQQRTTIGVIAFRGIEASLILKPTKSLELAREALYDLPTGGRTPLPDALSSAATLLRRFGLDQGYQPVLILLTDGKANVGISGGDPWAQSLTLAAELKARVSKAVLINADPAYFTGTGRAEELAVVLGANYLSMAEISGEALTPVIKFKIEELN